MPIGGNDGSEKADQRSRLPNSTFAAIASCPINSVRNRGAVTNTVVALDYFPKRNTVAEDFRLARRRADMQSIVLRLSGKSAELLSYEEMRTKLRARESSSRFLRDIPLAAIIGSVGRYDDFTRDF